MTLNSVQLFSNFYPNETLNTIFVYFQVDVQSCGVDSLSDSNHIQSTSQYNLANYIKVRINRYLNVNFYFMDKYPIRI